MNGGGNYSPGNGSTPNNRGHHFGGNHGHQNNIEYLRAVSHPLYVKRSYSLLNIGAGRWR